MEKCIIVAIADNRAIGKSNALLWHIAEDMKYFRQTTTGSPVVMGWMTFQSIGGKPLPKRDNVVISIFPWPDKPEGVTEVASLEEAYQVLAHESGKVFVMGGGETYRQALPTADKLYITHVHTTIEDADTFFLRVYGLYEKIRCFGGFQPPQHDTIVILSEAKNLTNEDKCQQTEIISAAGPP